MKTIVILGGGGFLGNYIARHYRGCGWRVVAVGRGAASADGDVRHVWHLPHAEFAHLIAVEQPDLCVNAAGRASVPASMVEPLDDFQTSTLLNYQVLNDLRRSSSGTRYIHLSSAAVYGNPSTLPVREDAQPAPISPYGWHKQMSEEVLAEHAGLFGMRAASVRIFSAYGAGLRRQVIWDLAKRAIAEPDRPLRVEGRAEDSRDFVHGADIAAAIEAVAERADLRGECYNVGQGEEIRIADLAALVMQLLCRRPEIEFDGVGRPGKPSRWHADISRLSALGFKPQVSLTRGVEEVIGEVKQSRG